MLGFQLIFITLNKNYVFYFTLKTRFTHQQTFQGKAKKSCWFGETKVWIIGQGGQIFFFFLFIFFKCVHCIYCSKCLCSCTIELNKTKKQQHNFIPLSCAPFQCLIALMCQNESKVWHIFGEIEYRNSLLFQEKPSETFLQYLKKKFRVRSNFRVGRVTPNQLFFLGLINQWNISGSIRI